ncbi:MAG: ABC-F family ATP-binding cassette domain-containing protein [Lentisphaeria bacterium]|nr:ABC-F family ATP-binding cassette domain-containing protein [Lentisphaeria bacterium]
MAERVLWTGDHLKLQIGQQVLFDDAFFSINDNERVALVGRNGAGKSTLMKIIAGQDSVSSGNISSARNLRIAYMPQEFTLPPDQTVREAVRGGAAFFDNIMEEYSRLPADSHEHEHLENLLNIHDAWDMGHKIDVIMEKLRLTFPEKRCSELSGGELRRVMLARTIAAEPDLLLLDEPTNHLDVDMIAWIENFLAAYKGACLFVTHDRFFLDRIATRIVELDHGSFYSYEGSYADFLAGKEEREYNEDVLEQKRKSFLRMEIEWVRRSPKARLRRNLGRIKRYEEIAAINAPQRTGDVELLIPKATHLGNRVVELKNVTLSLGGKKLLDHFDFEFTAGMKIGIVGANGAGKTTLLRLITGGLQPDSGEIFRADTVEFNYVDQNRLALTEENTVLEEIGEGHEHINLGSERVTVWGYLRRFLFEDERINTKIKRLSGGERARLTLAKILRGGGNFLILDEPTNDLDLSTLRVLEEALANYTGCLTVVSHDRYFLNRVCTHILAFEPEGSLRMEVGDYDNYAAKRAARLEAEANRIAKENPAPVRNTPAKPKNQPKNGLTYKEEREIESLEIKIEEMENRIAEIEATFSDPEFFRTRAADAAPLQKELEKCKADLDSFCARWEELESKRI